MFILHAKNSINIIDKKSDFLNLAFKAMNSGKALILKTSVKIKINGIKYH